jgi:hypothetical protein
VDSWPAFRESAIRQWNGLEEGEREYVEAIIARRDHYGFPGCVTGSDFVRGQILRPIWTVQPLVGTAVDLIAVKVEL